MTRSVKTDEVRRRNSNIAIGEDVDQKLNLIWTPHCPKRMHRTQKIWWLKIGAEAGIIPAEMPDAETDTRWEWYQMPRLKIAAQTKSGAVVSLPRLIQDADGVERDIGCERWHHSAGLIYCRQIVEEKVRVGRGLQRTRWSTGTKKLLPRKKKKKPQSKFRKP